MLLVLFKLTQAAGNVTLIKMLNDEHRKFKMYTAAIR